MASCLVVPAQPMLALKNTVAGGARKQDDEQPTGAGLSDHFTPDTHAINYTFENNCFNANYD